MKYRTEEIIANIVIWVIIIVVVLVGSLVFYFMYLKWDFECFDRIGEEVCNAEGYSYSQTLIDVGEDYYVCFTNKDNRYEKELIKLRVFDEEKEECKK